MTLPLIALLLASYARAAIPLGDGLRLVPANDTRKAPRCLEKKHYYRLTGLRDLKTQKKISDLMRSAVEIEGGCSKSEAELDEALQPYSFERGVKDVRKIGDRIVFKVEEISYTGGVHESFSYQTHVIDLKQGERIDLETLFSERGRDELNALLRTKLKQYYKSRNEPEWTTRDVRVRANQILPSGNGFLVQFNPYEIDCFAAGAPVLKFTAEEAALVFRPSTLFGTKRW